jgi:hypothetical protein
MSYECADCEVTLTSPVDAESHRIATRHVVAEKTPVVLIPEPTCRDGLAGALHILEQEVSFLRERSASLYQLKVGLKTARLMNDRAAELWGRCEAIRTLLGRTGR